MSRFKHYGLLVVLVMLVCFSQVALADVIVLKNGNKIVGEISSTMGAQVIIVDEYGIEYRINKADVENIYFSTDEVPDAGPASPPTVPGTPSAPVGGSSTEIEPNNEFCLATTISYNSTISGSINPKGDHDFFKLAIDKPGILNIAVKRNDPAAKACFRVMSAENSVIQNWVTAELGQDAQGSVDIPFKDCPTDIYIEVRQSGDNHTFDYTMDVRLQEINDIYESNDSWAESKEIPLDQEIQAYIFPKGDADFYYVQVPGPGQILVTMSHADPAMIPSIRFADNNYSITKNWETGDYGKPVSSHIDFAEPGLLYIEARQSGHNLRSGQPYTLKTEFSPAADEFEPNNTFAESVSIPLNQPVQAHIFPQGDQDFYELNVERMGYLHFEINCPDPKMKMSFRIMNANNSVIQNWITANNPGDPVVGVIEALPGKYVLQVNHAGGNQRSLTPYQVLVRLEEVPDSYEPNDKFSQAKPITVGTPVEARIFPKGDRDFYYFTVPADSEVIVEAIAPSPLVMNVRLLNANNSVTANWQRAAAPGEKARLEGKVKAGICYVEVAHAGDNLSRNEPYTLVVTFK